MISANLLKMPIIKKENMSKSVEIGVGIIQQLQKNDLYYSVDKVSSVGKGTTWILSDRDSQDVLVVRRFNSTNDFPESFDVLAHNNDVRLIVNTYIGSLLYSRTNS